MSLKNQIDQDIKHAMKSRDSVSLRGLRAIKAEILLAETAEGQHAAALTEAQELKLLAKQAKQRKDSIDQYSQNGRDDLAKIEAEELAVIERYLPKQLSVDEIAAIIKPMIAQVGATSMRDMGKVMGLANKQLAGKADGKVIAQIVKELLS